MGNELMNKINFYLKNNTKRKHLYQILIVLCVAIAFLVYSIMTKPAISMAFDNINVESMRENTSFGQVVPVRVTAEALEGNDPTNFVIYTEGVGGGLSSEYQFDQENTCEITAEDGKTVKLHKEDVIEEESGDVVKHNYWFTLQPEEKVAFTLNYTSDVEAISTLSNGGSSTEVLPSEEQSSEQTSSSTEATTETSESKPEEKPTEEPATTESKPEEKPTEEPVTTESKPEEKPTEQPATTESKPEEKPTEEPATTESKQKEEPTEDAPVDEDFLVGTVGTKTYNQVALANVEYMDTKDIKTSEAEQPTTTKQEVVTEEVTTETTEDPVTTEATTETNPEESEQTTGTLPVEEGEGGSDTSVPVEKADQYLNIYVAASADEDYEGIANTLIDRVNGWNGVTPDEEIKNKKVANLYWTKEENITDVVIKARTEEGVLVTVTGDKNSFSEEQLKTLNLVVKEIIVRDELQEEISDSDTMDESQQAQTKKVDELLKEALGEESQNLLERRRFDIQLIANDQEIEPNGTLSVAFDNMEYNASAKKVKVFHIQDEQKIEEMNSLLNEDGTIRMETDHFSEFEVILIGENIRDAVQYDWEEPSDQNFLGTAHKFNMFLLGNLSNMVDVEGIVAIGGNIIYNNGGGFSVAGGATKANSPVSGLEIQIDPAALIFGGSSIEIDNGKIITPSLDSDSSSSIWVSSSLAEELYQKFDGYNTQDKIKIFENINTFFSSAKSSLYTKNEDLYNNIDKYTECEAKEEGGTLSFNYNGDEEVVVFNISIDSLNNVQTINFDIPETTQAIINIISDKNNITFEPKIDMKYATVHSSQEYIKLAGNILWNFDPNITTVNYNIKQEMLPGSVLAPKADFLIHTSVGINGTLVANNLTVKEGTGFECHYFPPRIPDETPDPIKGKLRDVVVKKEWKEGTGETVDHDPITVKLLRKIESDSGYSDTGMTAILSKDNNWKHVFQVPEKDSNGNTYSYTVEEVNVPNGYESTISEPKNTAGAWATTNGDGNSIDDLDIISKECIIITANANPEDKGNAIWMENPYVMQVSGSKVTAEKNTTLPEVSGSLKRHAMTEDFIKALEELANNEDAIWRVEQVSKSGDDRLVSIYNPSEGKYLYIDVQNRKVALTDQETIWDYNGFRLEDDNGNTNQNRKNYIGPYQENSQEFKALISSGNDLKDQAQCFQLYYWNNAKTEITITNTKVDTPTTVPLEIQKVDSTETKALSGAAFSLYKVDNDNGTTIPEIEHKVSLVAENLTSDSEGKISVGSVEIGQTYYLVETKAPAGYQILSGPIKFIPQKTTITIENSNTIAKDITNKEGSGSKIVLQVQNTQGYQLPDTGGEGTVSLTVTGISLMAVAVVGMFFMRKRQEHRGEV